MFARDLNTKYASTFAQGETQTKKEWLEEISSECYHENSEKEYSSVEEYFDEMVESEYLVEVE